MSLLVIPLVFSSSNFLKLTSDSSFAVQSLVICKFSLELETCRILEVFCHFWAYLGPLAFEDLSSWQFSKNDRRFELHGPKFEFYGLIFKLYWN